MFSGAKSYHKRFVGWVRSQRPWVIAVGIVVGIAALPLPIYGQEPAPILPAIAPFTTDGCSIFPDGPVWAHTLWRRCCVEHDFAYWQGGDYWARMAADEALLACVRAVGEPVVGVTMLLGVRIGGSPFWPTDFRWGYGWQVSRGYKPLTALEAAAVESMLKKQQLLQGN